MVAASGDDKVNLVVSLLAKTEFGVPRTVARVNNPKNEWMFDEAWGVDVAVSTPRLMTALVEEAVCVGDLVRIFTFQQGQATMVELTLPADSPYVGARVGDVDWPPDTVLVCIIREERPIAPSRDDALEANDELMFVTVPGERGRAAGAAQPGPPPPLSSPPALERRPALLPRRRAVWRAGPVGREARSARRRRRTAAARGSR